MSSIHSIDQAFENANASLLGPTDALLAQIVGGASLRHAYFMNTLSMLEHLGSYKIMATQHGAGIDEPTLRHLADETRHAFFFKRQAERVAKRSLAYRGEDMLAAASALMYFRRLESKIHGAFPVNVHPRTVYLYMSLMVELRAIWFYRRYQRALKKGVFPLSLETLMAEEIGHLTDMTWRLGVIGDLTEASTQCFLDTEKNLYERVLINLQRAINGVQDCGEAVTTDKV